MGKTLEDFKKAYERNKKIKEMLNAGNTLREISEKFNISKTLPSLLKNNYEDIQNRLLEKIRTYEKVIELYKEGYTVSEIAEKMGTTKQNISRILKLGNVSRESGGISKRRERIVKKIKEMTEQGITLERISEKLGISEMSVRKYAYDEGIELISETSLRVTRLKEQAIELKKQGMTQVEIAEKLGLSQGYVSKFLLDENIRTRLKEEEYRERDQKIYEEYQKGLTVKELSEKFNLTEINIRRILYKFSKTEQSETQLENDGKTE